MSASKRRAPGPWSVRYRQVNDRGVRSRPQLLDCRGRPVSLGSGPNAELMARAPEMLDLLRQVESEATLWYLMLRAEHPTLPRPAWLTRAEGLVRALGG